MNCKPSVILTVDAQTFDLWDLPIKDSKRKFVRGGANCVVHYSRNRKETFIMEPHLFVQIPTEDGGSYIIYVRAYYGARKVDFRVRKLSNWDPYFFTNEINDNLLQRFMAYGQSIFYCPARTNSVDTTIDINDQKIHVTLNVSEIQEKQ